MKKTVTLYKSSFNKYNLDFVRIEEIEERIEIEQKQDFNIFGEPLPFKTPIYKIEKKVRHHLLDGIKIFNTLDDARKFIKLNNYLFIETIFSEKIA